ncbi:MAG: DUF4038 domain-containing protein [Cyclobacteriaceae bacterium]|nr:DUF4038 domain-containing protein [Cyclobacteriaceae bacterium]
MKKHWFLFITALIVTGACTRGTEKDAVVAEQWSEISIELLSEMDYANPYTDVEVYALFTHESHGKIRRPAFWDGGNSWKVRFASPVSEGSWQWESFSSEASDKGLHGRKGKLESAAYSGDNHLIANGLLRMSPGKRNAVHANGKPFFVIGDTPWALPWRATHEDVKVYAADRQSKGFNAALLMSFCPDTEAQGPDARATLQGFARAFEDIEEGHINKPVISYFQYFDQLVDVLIAHGIVPVYQPIFHGYGWKGLKVLGWDTQPEEYERYMKYLIARYGARPAFWLVGGDGDGRSAGIMEAGKITQQWDDYQQPTGIHYNPFDTPSEGHPNRYPHENKTYQDETWLDFQWCQTGHGGEHQFYKVEKMYDNLPVKAVANGEPTYEGIRDPENGAGWWQGHEAWGQFTSGGTMGVVYGAGGIWQWKISAEEEGWPAWANSEISWRDALHLEGSTYVGYMKEALHGLDIKDIEKRHDLAGGKLCLAKAGKTYLVYLPEGGEVQLQDLVNGLPFVWFNPKTAEFTEKGSVGASSQTFTAPDKAPWVLIIGSREL